MSIFPTIVMPLKIWKKIKTVQNYTCFPYNAMDHSNNKNMSKTKARGLEMPVRCYENVRNRFRASFTHQIHICDDLWWFDSGDIPVFKWTTLKKKSCGSKYELYWTVETIYRH